MAPKIVSAIRSFILVLAVCWSAVPTAALAAAPADSSPLKTHVIKFYLDPALVPDIEFARTVLPKYVADMNAVLAKNTDRRLVFDPQTGIVLTSSQPQTNSARPPLPTEGFEIWANATFTASPSSYGGYAGIDASGAGVLAGLFWTRLYDPDNLSAAGMQDYALQLDHMLHELAHVFGAGIGEYYNLAHISDTTHTAPLLNIDVNNVQDPFWSDKPDFAADPLMRFTTANSRTAYLAAVRYSNLTAAVLNGDYRNGIPSFGAYTIQVSDSSGQPVPAAQVQVWNVQGIAPDTSQLLFDGPADDNGQVVLPWGGTGEAHSAGNFLRLIKVSANGQPLAQPRYVSIYDADSAALLDGDSSYTVTIVTNDPPTDISLSNTRIGQHQPANTLVGNLSTRDSQAGAAFTYSFCGGPDDASFKIGGSSLTSAAVFDHASRNAYNICIQTADALGATFRKSFTIAVDNQFSTTFKPSGAGNGWILETAAGSQRGGSLSAGGANLMAGDDALNRQYKSFLSFNTAALPDNALITGVTLQIRQSGKHGMDAFSALNGLGVDVRRAYFGPTLALQAADFQTASDQDAAAAFSGTPSNGWFTADLSGTAGTFINLNGTTQFRLRFQLANNNNRSADYLTFYGGTAAAANQPLLIVQYVIP